MFNWLNRLIGRSQERSVNLNQLKTFVYGPPTMAGVAISEEIATGISAVHRAVDLIGGKMAGLEGGVFRDIPSKGRVEQRRHIVNQLLRYPNDYINADKFWQVLFTHKLCSGNAYAEIERSTKGRLPVGLHIRHWRNVEVKILEDGTVFYHLRKEGKDVAARDMLHLTGLTWDGIVGISPIRAMRESLGISIAAERYAASVFGNGGVPRGVLKVKGVPNEITKANIREAWDILHGGLTNANKMAILSADTEWIETNMTPEDAALLGQRAFQIQEVARIFGVPENMLFSGSQSYNSNEENNQQFYESCLRGHIQNLEAELDFKCLSLDERIDGYSIRYNVAELSRGNFEKTVNSWSRLVLTGISTPNEARQAIGENPIDGGDERLIPSNMIVAKDDKGNDVLQVGLGDQSNQTEQPAGVDSVADTALNGAQIASLLEVLEQVATGQLPAESAKAVLVAAFPTIDASIIEAILKPLEGFEPAQEPKDEPNTEASDEANDDGLKSAVRAVLLDQVGRALRRQQKSKPTADEFRQYLTEAVESAYRAYALATDAPPFEDFVTRWIARTDLDTVTPQQLLEGK